MRVFTKQRRMSRHRNVIEAATSFIHFTDYFFRPAERLLECIWLIVDSEFVETVNPISVDVMMFLKKKG